jgi:CRISPR-associated protein Csx17
MPFRRHLASLLSGRFSDTWDDKTPSRTLVLWTRRDLVRDMAAILERRLVEAQRRQFTNEKNAELPLRGWRVTPLASVAAFLGRRTNDDRIAVLAAGLAWAKTRTGALPSTSREDALPFAYAALKPLLTPEGVGPKSGQKRLLDPLPLVRLIRANRAADAVTLAQRLGRGAGLPAPFSQFDPTPPPDPARLAAALLFPVAPLAQDRLLDRAYPDLKKDEDEAHAD